VDASYHADDLQNVDKTTAVIVYPIRVSEFNYTFHLCYTVYRHEHKFESEAVYIDRLGYFGSHQTRAITYFNSTRIARWVALMDSRLISINERFRLQIT